MPRSWAVILLSSAIIIPPLVVRSPLSKLVRSILLCNGSDSCHLSPLLIYKFLCLLLVQFLFYETKHMSKLLYRHYLSYIFYPIFTWTTCPLHPVNIANAITANIVLISLASLSYFFFFSFFSFGLSYKVTVFVFNRIVS